MKGINRLSDAEAKIASQNNKSITNRKGASTEMKQTQLRNRFGFLKVQVADNERALLFKDRNFKSVLEPGIYWFIDVFHSIEVEIYDFTVPEFSHRLDGLLLNTQKPVMEHYFQIVELNDSQVGLVFKDGKLANVLAPATQQLYWRGPIDVSVRVINIADDFEIAKSDLVLLQHAQGLKNNYAIGAMLYFAEVQDNQVGLLKVNGMLQKVLDPGVYGYWCLNQRIAVDVIETHMQTLEVLGQEVLTKDKVSLRINLAANYRIKDPVIAVSELGDVKTYLYKELQFGTRDAVGTRTLDELLGKKGELNSEVFNYVRDRTAAYGIIVEQVGVKDIVLPGDMKDILNQVVTAEKAAQANIIRRREETAATRSLLNTAKVMGDNPVLMRLKEMEVLEKVTEKIGHLTVFSGIEGVLKDLVKIQT